MKYFKGLSFYIVIFVLAMFLVMIYTSTGNPAQLSYTQLLSQIENSNVQSITLKADEATVELITPNKGSKTKEYVVYISSVDSFTDMVTEAWKNGQVKDFRVQRPPTAPWWISILPTLGLIVIFVIFWVFFLQQSQAGGGNRVMSFGKSRARISTDEKRKVTFEDVAGADEEKEELKEIVEFLKSPKKFIELGARIPKGVLLVGPPGTGKTLLARAVSGEAGVPFFSISGSDFVEMFVGVGASRVRDLFEQAKKSAPCMVFIDEIDAVGRHRGAGLGGGHDEREQTLNQLLVEMDGFGVNEGVIILAATNRPDILDPALLRPGRFDRRIYVGLPDIKGREAILKVHARGKPLGSDVKLDELAKSTPGFTGADLENLLNEAALLAARQNKKRIEMEQIKEATFKVVVGPEKKSKVMSEKEKKLTAYHEAGHAIAVKVASSTNKVDRVSIIPSGRAGGYTAHKPDEDKSYHTKSQLMEEIIILMGGRAAEDIVLGEISTGASHDLKHANGIARNMIIKYGMSETLGNMVFDDNGEVFIGRDFGHTKSYSEEMAAIIDKEIKNIIDTAYEKTVSILKEHINALHKVAEALLEKEKLEGHEFEAIFAGA
ncbi:MAG: ATP-dependent zinc metalloprotease FtsH [Acetivibrionales bacterium]|mgnify:FL=1|nr:ATP-dependent zinc metalloprotease FtsH [Bacillota bacterium]NLP07122.1 ATP-dependent metallopeptidase FtsH/Yme1/Tma family protein [Clostridiaceae bacterium]HOA54357.1 ATP-dependent zinc metalloprotease FtsH [Clostridiales bacterium]HPZ05707.1 ATP-dependent zinc metalloprotease FtsH [Clostridiales bacterium]HQD31709.1 ATP-dependent zinc metalloprotease FtsH [Clostridiales bacterium]